jgi:acetamidase/formamidase/AraC-like DNA-binding protein
MDNIYFTTEAHASSERPAAWRSALAGRLLLPIVEPSEQGLHGTVNSFTTPLGLIVARLTGTRQTLSFVQESAPEDIWLALQLDGTSTAQRGATALPLAAGDVAYGSADRSVSLAPAGSFRLCLVRIPYAALRARLLTPGTLQLGTIAGQSANGRLIAGLLTPLAEDMRMLDKAYAGAIELAIIEFVVTIFATAGMNNLPAGLTSTQASEVQRMSQIVESRLSDPALSLNDVATSAGLSPRYLQKLCESIGESFTHFLRLRRLERCRSDLADPLYSHLSISDILFRWGFNDAAHFSHAFRNQYGKSARDYRQEMSGENARRALSKIGRGWPEHSVNAVRKAGTVRRPGTAEPAAGAQAGATPAPEVIASGAVHHYLPVTSKTVHWGYFSRTLTPVMHIDSEDIVTIETLTHHAYDDYERMIRGDSGAEDVFLWTKERKNVDRRGAGPMNASIFGRGAGEGFGVHICTGPIHVRDAKPGDVLEIRILDVWPRLSANTQFAGRAFGSNAAAWWGFHYKELLTDPRPREVVTIYELDSRTGGDTAKALYNFRWEPQRDPYGVIHKTIDYPGVPVDHDLVTENHDVLRGIKIPVQPHFGVIAVAPREAEIVDSIPPSYFGGNIDNRRAGKGSRMYLPVSVAGALLSIGDPHASQGDSELCGTAIECSLTGVFQVILHKRADLAGKPFADLSYPLLETAEEWIIHGFSYPNYLAELGDKAQSEIYNKSSLDLAMRDAYRKTRRFLLHRGLTEDEAISLMSVAVDFGVTQVVDGNWSIHSIVRKALFED